MDLHGVANSDSSQRGTAVTSSSFLSLPPELRLRVYELTMDVNQTVHVGQPGHRAVRLQNFNNICVASAPDSAAYAAIKSMPKQASDPVARRHRACCAPRGLSANLALLRACKLINSECLGMLLGQNTLTFSDPDDMERFMKRLPLRQHCLLKQITIYLLGNQPNWCRMSQKWFFERLTGLKHINVYLELTHGHLAMIKQDNAKFGGYGPDNIIKTLYALVEVPPRSADVKITPPLTQRTNVPDFDAISQAEIAKWEDHVHNKICPPNTTVPDKSPC